MIIGFVVVLGVVALGEGVREVCVEKPPEYYLGTFLYAIGMLAIAGMMCYLERRVPSKRE